MLDSGENTPPPPSKVEELGVAEAHLILWAEQGGCQGVPTGVDEVEEEPVQS